MDNQKIHEMKKVILHLHLDGSLRPETVREWLKEDGENLSLEEVQSKLMVNKDCKDLNEYLEKFDIPSKVLQTEERLERATYELYEDLSKQNVIYAEVRFAPSKHIDNGLTYKQVVQSTINGLKRAKEDFNIDGNLILCCMRGDNNAQENLETVVAAKKFLNKGVAAVDLAGAEALFPTLKFEDIFRLASQNGIPLTIHAGEAAGPESVKLAIQYANRIGHGIRSIESEELINELREKGITLEVCPTSNDQTQAVEGKHPLEELYRKGIKTTISTDNNTVSNVDIEEEYRKVLENTNLTYNDLVQMNINAARAIFDTPEKKAKLVGILQEQLKQFEQEKQREN